MSAPEITASAPGKTILVGEHAVVYGRPALAVPVSGRRAFATVRSGASGSGVVLHALDLDRQYAAAEIAIDEEGRFLGAALSGVQRELGVNSLNLDLEIEIRSEIPIARGMGSGAAVSAALMRAVAGYLGAEIAPERLSSLVYETEKLLHGTPSGIDNTTVVYERPVWYAAGTPPGPITVGQPFMLLIGDTGLPARTRESVAMVRGRWQCEPQALEEEFDAIAGLAVTAREAIAAGQLADLGRAMSADHEILARMGVSSRELDRLVQDALSSGALGAKLSGGGMGGCMIALVADEALAGVSAALTASGAAQVIVSRVNGGG